MLGLFRRKRGGPAGPAPATAGESGPPGRPRVEVFRFASGRGVSGVGPGESVPERELSSALVLVLAGRFTGAADVCAGDVLLASGPPGRLVCVGPDPGLLLLQRLPQAGGGPAVRVGREELSGEPVAGVTGARLVLRSAGRSVLRLGPPPGARWVVSGLSCFAVFRGKMEVVEGDDALAVRQGEVAFVSGAEAPLYLQAGGDSALAVGLGGPAVLVGLA